MVVEQRDAGAAQQQQRGVSNPNPTGGGGSITYKGLPEPGGTNPDGAPVHFVLFKMGNRVCAFPADQWLGFKPHIDRWGAGVGGIMHRIRCVP